MTQDDEIASSPKAPRASCSCPLCAESPENAYPAQRCGMCGDEMDGFSGGLAQSVRRPQVLAELARKGFTGPTCPHCGGPAPRCGMCGNNPCTCGSGPIHHVLIGRAQLKALYSRIARIEKLERVASAARDLLTQDEGWYEWAPLEEALRVLDAPDQGGAG